MLIPSLLGSRATSPTILHEERFEAPQNHEACLVQLIGVQFLSVSCRSYLIICYRFQSAWLFSKSFPIIWRLDLMSSRFARLEFSAPFEQSKTATPSPPESPSGTCTGILNQVCRIMAIGHRSNSFTKVGHSITVLTCVSNSCCWTRSLRFDFRPNF